MYFICLLCILLIQLVISEHKENDILKREFLEASINTNSSTNNVSYDTYWVNSDWTTKTSEELSLGIVTDSRWQEFETLYNTTISVLQYPQTYTAFSIYSASAKTDITFNLSNNIYEKAVNFSLKGERWLNFVVESHKDYALFWQNGITLKNISLSSPKNITVQSMFNVFWKKHQYKFKWSNQTTTNGSSYFRFPIKSQCYILYVSLKNSSYLDIILNSTAKQTKNYVVNPDKKSAWKAILLESNNTDLDGIWLYRRINGSDKYGHWAIDIRLCNEGKVSIEPLVDDDTTKTVYYRELHTFELSCILSTFGPVEWFKDGTNVQLIDNLENRFTTVITNRTIAKYSVAEANNGDVGQYQCALIGQNKTHTASALINLVKLIGESKTFGVKVPKDITIDEGEALEIQCLTIGTSSVYWIFENDTHKTIMKYSTERVTLEHSVTSITNGLLRIQHTELYDRGKYTCTFRELASSSAMVRIKSKYAALWPLLGICVQIVILCGTIYFCKKHGSDTNESNTDED